MNKQLHRAVRRWIDSESGAQAAEADAALAAVFESLPLAAPSAGFAGRVMERAGLVRSRSSTLTRSWRAALAACLLLAGLAAAILPPILVRLVDPLSSIRLLEWGAALFLGLVHRLADSLSVWTRLVDAGYGMRLAFSNPPMLVAVTAALLLSITAFRLLHGLLTADRRRTGYVY